MTSYIMSLCPIPIRVEKVQELPPSRMEYRHINQEKKGGMEED